MPLITQLPLIEQHRHLPPAQAIDGCLRTDAVYVVYTSTDHTLAALRVAGSFAKALDVQLILVHYRTVPYALALEAPTGVSPIESEEFRARIQREQLDVEPRVVLCRDDRDAISRTFTTPSLIVVGTRKCWRPARERGWRRMLEATGHCVVLVEESADA